MEKKIIVLSLGGSLIAPDEIDLTFLNSFKKIIKKHTNKYKFIVVCGGGSIARKYIKALRQAGKSEYIQSLSGIAVTRLNARFLNWFFNQDAEKGIPHDMMDVKNLLAKNDTVFCGALRYAQKETSDATSAKLASFFKTEFINLTLVSGLHDKNPLTHKNARFIPKISWNDFCKMASKIKFKPGQHFVLDQHASKIIKNHKIKTYIIGKNLKNLDNLLIGKKFKGTIIGGD